MNKKFKILTKQNIRTTTKFLYFLIKNIKYFNKEKKLKLHSNKNHKQKVKNHDNWFWFSYENLKNFRTQRQINNMINVFLFNLYDKIY